MYRLTRNFDLIIFLYKTSFQCFVQFHLAQLVCLVFLFHSGVLGVFIYLLRPKKLSLCSEKLLPFFVALLLF